MTVDLTQIPASCGQHATLAECSALGDTVAAIVTAVAAAKFPDDPEAATAHALAAVDMIYSRAAERAAAGPVGPDYPPELETADQAAADLIEQELF